MRQQSQLSPQWIRLVANRLFPQLEPLSLHNGATAYVTISDDTNQSTVDSMFRRHILEYFSPWPENATII